MPREMHPSTHAYVTLTPHTDTMFSRRELSQRNQVTAAVVHPDRTVRYGSPGRRQPDPTDPVTILRRSDQQLPTDSESPLETNNVGAPAAGLANANRSSPTTGSQRNFRTLVTEVSFLNCYFNGVKIGTDTHRNAYTSASVQ